jgi:hypothetical protein
MEVKMSDLRKGILKVFLSSTFKDLQPMREKLIERLDGALMSAAMEKFIPTGETSQKIALEELKESDLAVFLISPYYGTDISTCEFISECQADCGMKSKAKKEKISYTWCEYRFARGLNKPHFTYILDEGWDRISRDASPKVWKLRDEVEKISGLCPRIKTDQGIVKNRRRSRL